MLPEISHRCPSCGASVRDFGERAMFCPECGETLTVTSAEKEDHEDSRVAAESATNDDHAEAAVLLPAADAESVTAKSQPAEPAVVRPEEEVGAAKPVVTDPSNEPVIEDRHTKRERTRETLQRASTRARGAIEDNVKRVEKIHHVSSVMFEEAHYDPSLRFVLVALGLFVVFVVLLILSKVMG